MYEKFEKNIYVPENWKCHTLISSKEIKKYCDLNLIGKTITALRIVGYNYTFSKEYGCLLGSERNFIDTDLFSRSSEIDTPLLILLNDGTQFEIDILESWVYNLSLNQIPYDIKDYWDNTNIDANILFAPCIGQKIISVEYEEEHTDNRVFIGEYKYKGPDYINSIILRFEDGNGLKLYGYIDFFEIEYIDHNNIVQNITYSELKRALLQ